MQKNLPRRSPSCAPAPTRPARALPDIRVMVRTGDTPARERAGDDAPAAAHPHHHARVALHPAHRREEPAASSPAPRRSSSTRSTPSRGDKRGAHLALSLERLDALAGRRAAAHRPLGDAEADRGGRRACSVGTDAAGAPRRSSTSAIGARSTWRSRSRTHELGPIATHELWAAIYDRIVALTYDAPHDDRVREHAPAGRARRARARGAARRRPRRRAPRQHGAPHRGSRPRRGSRRARCRWWWRPPRSSSASTSAPSTSSATSARRARSRPLLQRVGRSGPRARRRAEGHLLPAHARRPGAVRGGGARRARRRARPLAVPPGALDILAQQCVATVAAGEIGVEELLALVRRAYPYPRPRRAPRFDAVLDMLAEGVVDAARAALRRSSTATACTVGCAPRRGARLAAITSGGAIPDTADYDVVEEPHGRARRQGERGLRGREHGAATSSCSATSSWRIRRVEAGRVRVEDAGTARRRRSRSGWARRRRGRASCRGAVGRLRAEVAARLDDTRARSTWLVRRVRRSRPSGAEQLVAYVADGARARSAPCRRRRTRRRRALLRRGGRHAARHPRAVRRPHQPRLGPRAAQALLRHLRLRAAGGRHRRRHRPLARRAAQLPARERLRDGPARHARARTWSQAALASPMFTNRWRWNATRALALLRHEGGKRVPMPLQRMRAEDLLAAVFPEQARLRRQSRRRPDHRSPTIRSCTRRIDNCLHEAMDVDGLAAVLDAHRARRDPRPCAVETAAPSPMSHEILNSNPYTYLDDAPLEERRARAVSLRQTDAGPGGRPRRARPRGDRRGARARRGRTCATPTSCTTSCCRSACCRAPSSSARMGGARRRTLLAHAARDLDDRPRGARALVAAERVRARARSRCPTSASSPRCRSRSFVRRGEREPRRRRCARSSAAGSSASDRRHRRPSSPRASACPTSRVAIGLAPLERAGVPRMRGRYRAGRDRRGMVRAPRCSRASTA